MTSQIAISNLNGVAVASDTVVTISQGQTQKTLGNTNKIYQLGGEHNILVLHSGSATINNIPQSLHIYEWAKTLGEPKPTVQAYVDSYKTWTAGEAKLNNPESEKILLHWILNDHYYFIQYRIRTEVENMEFEEGVTEKKKASQRTQHYLKIVKEGLEHLENLEIYNGLTDKSAAKIITDLGINVKEKIDYIFLDFPPGPEAEELLLSSAPLVLSRSQPMDIDSELGFAGFGTDEPYPHVIRVSCRGIYGKTLALSITTQSEVNPPFNNSRIDYFAQRDAMYSFVNAVRPRYRDQVHQFISEEIEARWGAETKEPIGWEVADTVLEKLGNWAQEFYIDPMLDTISVLSMLGLADMAESLVSLQATAAAGKTGPATVGGLIEVATIDRINGIVWHTSLTQDI